MDIPWAIIVFETLSTWNQLCLMVLRNFDYFFIETQLFSQKDRNIDRFENSSAILRFETYFGKKTTKFSDFKNFRGLFGRKNFDFLKKTHFLNAMRSLIQKDHLKHFLKKLGHVQPFWENLGFFSKKTIYLHKKTYILNVFVLRLLKQMQCLGRLLEQIWQLFQIFKRINLFSKNLSVLPRKKEKLEPSEKFCAFLPLECLKIILQNFCQLKRFWKRWNSFPKTPM